MLMPLMIDGHSKVTTPHSPDRCISVYVIFYQRDSKITTTKTFTISNAK